MVKKSRKTHDESARRQIEQLVAYGLHWRLLEEEDVPYAKNRLYDHLQCQLRGEWQGQGFPLAQTPRLLLEDMVEEQVNLGYVEDLLPSRQRWMMDAMDILMPRPSEVKRRFEALEMEESADAALEYFYRLSQKSGYIQMDQIAKNEEWVAKTHAGGLEITINLSKPEKDPKLIALRAKEKKTGYPACVLCLENVGNGGSLQRPARRNHRVIPLDLAGERWGLQFSPYLYYNEHCICFNNLHMPMKITKKTYERLFDFIDRFPGYFIGSNADLPIVGGSILSHDHFQGGRHDFPMMKAEDARVIAVNGITVSRLAWPMSAIRLKGTNRKDLIEQAVRIQDKWCQYNNEALGILAETDQPHQAVTPILRRDADAYVMEIVLRNNRTNTQFPDGIFHPHVEWHSIKKENIGLIEVMGRAILPARIQKDRLALADWLMKKEKKTLPEGLAHHQPMVRQFLDKGEDPKDLSQARAMIDQAIGQVFEKVLEDAGVFKQTPQGIQAFDHFLRSCL